MKNHWVVNVEGQSSNWGGCVSEAYRQGKFVLDIGHLCPVITMELERGAPIPM